MYKASSGMEGERMHVFLFFFFFFLGGGGGGGADWIGTLAYIDV